MKIDKAGFPYPPAILHFIGIGGIGMSGIARIFSAIGYKTQGSDAKKSYITQGLSKIGVKVFAGHNGENVDSRVALVIKSTAIIDTNPEIIAAIQLGIPTITRAEALAVLMENQFAISVAGTHGKTTTTAMIATILTEAARYPTVVNGGIINNYGTNAILGDGKIIVVEADESDGSFLILPTDIAVVTNIDPEHMDYYHSFEAVLDAYRKFIYKIKPNGQAVVCGDHSVLKEVTSSVKLDNPLSKIITYGFDKANNVQALNLCSSSEGTYFDIVIQRESTKAISDTIEGNGSISKLLLPAHGEHNVLNAVAAIAVAFLSGISETEVRDGLQKFCGVKRRFTKVGEVKGITIIDDYAHHPQEIAAVIKAARTYISKIASDQGRLIAVIQPHRYTRLSFLMNEFVHTLATSEVDLLVVSDVYPANEQPVDGVSSKILVDKILQYLYTNPHNKLAIDKVVFLPLLHNLHSVIANIAKSGDIVLCMGAGDITDCALSLIYELGKI
ncbi:UDP-N-acetylmuramate--L-alanine ligase [Alphaproteobacteria bacterium]